jgi:hypothetical protein
MNKFALEQLRNVKVAELPPYDETTMSMVIPKQSIGSGVGVIRDHCYVLQLAPYVLNAPEGYTLHDNWNGGIPPKHEFMKAEVTQIMGKMIRVNGIGFDYKNNIDTNDVWEGWLPAKSITVIREL